jgi:hypothetical protein
MYRLIYNSRIKTTLPDVIQRIEDGAFIPVNTDNVDYQNYLKWVEEGNTILPPENQ